MAWRPLPTAKYNLYDEARQGEEGRPHHLGVVFQHCEWKGLQVGSLLGLAFGTPILYFKGARGKALVSRVAFVSGLGAIIGAPAVVGMCYFMLRNKSPEAIFDRAYRLNRNQEQNRCDWVSLGTAVTCGTIAMVTKTPPGVRGAVLAGFSGFGLGFILHRVTLPITGLPKIKETA